MCAKPIQEKAIVLELDSLSQADNPDKCKYLQRPQGTGLSPVRRPFSMLQMSKEPYTVDVG